ncbi:MAG: hypothetical protein C0485_03510 [Pirellula sp.]|nr:hypothetical protein [Pirellula sp.]
MGCGGRSPVSQLRDGTPAEAAARVMKFYDANSDGKVAADELAASPGLLDGLSRIDSNKDGAIDLEEMTARFGKHDEQSNIIAFQLNVAANGAPLDGAVVTFTPDPATAGEGKQSYSGTSAAGGVGLKGSELSMPGLPAGYYTVQISQPAQSIDFKRGVEIGDDVPSPNRITIDVSAKKPSGSSGR